MVRLCALLLWVALESAMRIAIESIVRAWLAIRPIRRWRRRKAMQSWADEHGGLPDEILEAFHEERKEVPMLQGKLTYSSVAVLALSWLAQRFDVPLLPEDATALVSAIGVIIGTVGGVYGRYRATKG